MIYIYFPGPNDYTFTTETLTLMSPLTERETIRVLITEDQLDEVDETLQLTLSIPSEDTGAIQLAPPMTTVTIIDDDGGCGLQHGYL